MFPGSIGCRLSGAGETRWNFCETATIGGGWTTPDRIIGEWGIFGMFLVDACSSDLTVPYATTG